MPPPDLPAKPSIELKRAKQRPGPLLNMLHSGSFPFFYRWQPLIHSQPPHPPPLQSLIVHILFSINTLEIGSGTVAQMDTSENIQSYTWCLFKTPGDETQNIMGFFLFVC